jgi:zinc protease
VGLGVGVALLVAGAAETMALPRVERLENGMTILIEEDHSRPLVAACLFVNGGSRTEPDSLKGLSHYYEHLIFRGGSRRQEPLEWRKLIQDIGDESGGYTTDDYTCYGFTVPADQLDEVLWRAADTWLELIPDAEKVDIERKVVLSEYWQDRDRPNYMAWYGLVGALYTEHPYRIPTIGLLSTLEQASLPTFRTFYHERYVPNQMILSFVGDFEADELTEKVRREFGRFERGRESFELGRREPPQESFRLAMQEMETPLTELVLGFRIPPARDPVRPALEVLSAVLGRGRASRLYRALERDQVVNTIEAGLDERMDDGIFVIAGNFEAAKAEPSLSGLLGEIARLSEEPVTDDELAVAKERVLADAAFRSQTFADRAERYAWHQLFIGLDHAAHHRTLIDAVTAADVREAARRYLRPDNATLSLVQNRESPVSESTVREIVGAWRQRYPGERTEGGDEGAAGAIHDETLDGGARVLVNELPHDRVAAGVIQLAGGLWTEPDGKCGVASALARLHLWGSRAYPGETLAAELERLGARLEASAGADAVEVSVVAPADKFADAFALVLDGTTHPNLDETLLPAVKADLLGAIKELESDPFRYTNRAFDAAVFAGTPYERSTLGDSASVEALGIADVRRYFEENVVGERAVVAVAGPVDHASVVAAVRGAFHDRRGTPLELAALSARSREAPVESWISRDQAQVTYNTGWPGVGMRDADYFPLRVAASVLGRRVFYEFVYERSMAYRSWFYMRDRLGPSAIQNEMGVAPEDYAFASARILEEVREFVEGDPPLGEIDSAKRRLVSGFRLRGQEPLALARTLATGGLLGAGAEYLTGYPAAVESVKPQRVLEVARRYLLPDRYVRVAVGAGAAAP